MSFPYLPKYAQLDKMAGAIVRSRGRCENCGTTQNLTWAHIVSRAVDHMRWDLDNALALCWNEYTGEGCHPYFTSHPKEWKEFLFNYIGEDKYWELIRRKNDQSLVDIDKNKIKYLLRKEIKRLKIKL